MSRAKSVPVFIVAKSAPWMNGTARMKATIEPVGNPGMCVSALSPAELTASSISGKTTGAMMFAGWRTVRTTERRASRYAWSAAAIMRAPSQGRRPAAPALRRRRPRASARSWRGRRRRATAGAAAAARPRDASPSSARTTSARSACPVCSRTATPRMDATGSPKRPRIAAARSRSAGSAGTTSTVGRPISAFNASGRALGDDPPVVDDPDAVGKHVRLLEVLRRQEDGHALLAWPAARTSSQSAVAALDVEPGGRLVEEQDARAMDERERQVEPALHPAGVAAHLAVGRVVETDALEQLVGARPALGPRQRLERRLQAQVLAAGEQRVERGLLERRPDRWRTSGPCFATSRPPTRACPRSAAAAWRASARSSTCLRRSGRESRRSRRGRLRGRCRRPPVGLS